MYVKIKTSIPPIEQVLVTETSQASANDPPPSQTLPKDPPPPAQPVPVTPPVIIIDPDVGGNEPVVETTRPPPQMTFSAINGGNTHYGGGEQIFSEPVQVRLRNSVSSGNIQISEGGKYSDLNRY